MMRCFGTVLLAGLVVLLGATPASAAWSRARLMTSVGTEQAMYPANTLSQVTMRPDLSADGRYVAFASTAKNLLAGLGPDVQAEATGAVFRRAIDGGTVEVVAVTNTTGPVSISADGRYVGFTSSRALLPEDTDTLTDVYVRDMDVAGGGLVLASAEAGAATTLPSEASISADGSRVLLLSGGQLDVRDVTSGTTTAVSDTVTIGRAAPVLSGDGSTVVWDDAQPQSRTSPAAFLPGERPIGINPTESDTDGWAAPTEILWRRLDQPLARRVATAGDNEDPGCLGQALPPDTSPIFVGVRGPCDGLFRFAPGVEPGGNFSASALSGDGRMLAFVTASRRRTGSTGSADLLVRDMHASGGRKATTRELTRFTDGGIVTSVTMSTDGSKIAYSSTTDQSTLPAPTLVSAGLGSGEANVYVVDLESDTIERVTRAYTGEPSNDLSDRPVISGDGSRLAFASVATNLLFGDANGAADVFVADRFDDSQPPLTETGVVQPGVVAATTTDRATEISPSWRLNVTVSRGGGVLYVDARVPARGTVTATARSTRRVRGRRTPRVIRTGKARAAAPGMTRVRLVLPVKYRSAARRATGLPVRVTVQFRPSGRGGTLTRRVDSVFRYRSRAGAKR